MILAHPDGVTRAPSWTRGCSESRGGTLRAADPGIAHVRVGMKNDLVKQVLLGKALESHGRWLRAAAELQEPESE